MDLYIKRWCVIIIYNDESCSNSSVGKTMQYQMYPAEGSKPSHIQTEGNAAHTCALLCSDMWYVNNGKLVTSDSKTKLDTCMFTIENLWKLIHFLLNPVVGIKNIEAHNGVFNDKNPSTKGVTYNKSLVFVYKKFCVFRCTCCRHCIRKYLGTALPGPSSSMTLGNKLMSSHRLILWVRRPGDHSFLNE